MRPVIAVTKPARKENWAYAAVAGAIRIAGGEPVALTPSAQRSRLCVNGIVFGGGDDIFPMLYDETPKQGYLYDRDRDALEVSAVEQASKQDIPAFGICRGAQLMNIVRGGALYADVSAEYADAAYPNGLWDKVFFRKCIYMEEGSILRRAIGQETTVVNSLHKQSVKRLGDGLEATAKEKNGVIQAIEDKNMSFFLGVQFHPEFLIYRRDVRRIFRQFVEVSRMREPVEIIH